VGPDLAGPLDTTSITFERWDVDTTRGTVTRTVLDDRGQEFPRIAPATYGTAARYTYSVGADGSGFRVLGLGNAVIKHDLLRGTSERWPVGPSRSTGEAVFVADPDRSGEEDGGWLLSFVYDAVTDRSSLTVLDAAEVIRGPVATVELPQRVPEGFHGNWYAAV
jgi:carotenoid cleavage dioxygenase